ncbi:MAG: hypothetical protein M1829_004256 [Trizodia sp. TS-e1964]|nr:MAG: hypothetical protein M1829_004256 [Trizodia sp. TS-e1964]
MLPPHCTPSLPLLTFLSTHLHTCVPTLPALLSTALGTLSILSWLFAQLPQIATNHRLKSTAGLSAFFLLEWSLGDSTNLLGALLTRQAAWQVIIAAYYVSVDIVLVWQYAWYTHLRPAREEGEVEAEEEEDEEEDKDAPTTITTTITPAPTTRTKPSLRTQALFLLFLLLPHRSSALPLPLSTTLTAPPPLLGHLFAWTSTALYLVSRLPQLWKNHARRSTAGLSPQLFLAAFCGNLCYASSLLANPCAWADYAPYGAGGWVGGEGSEVRSWRANAAPFWIGAAGVLMLDAAVGWQFWVFGEGGPWVPGGRMGAGEEEERECLVAASGGEREGYGTLG